MDKKNTRDNRLDFAKGLVAVFVLYAHLHPFDLTLDEKSNILLKALAFALKQFYWQVILILLPTFLLVALFITFGRLEQHGSPYFWKRIKRLLAISVFWISIQFAVYYVLVAVLKDPDYTWEIKTPPFRLLMLGGPNLPLVQGSVFYYFIILLVLTFLAYLFHAARDIKWFAPLAGGMIVLGTILYLELRNLNGQSLQYWRLENFLVYVPIAYFLKSRTSGQLKYLLILFFGLYLIFSIQDILLRQNGWNPGAYSRISLISGSCALFTWLLTKNESMKIPAAFSFFSIYALGIIAVHKFWQAFFMIALTPLGLSKYLQPLNLEAILVAVLVTLSSIATVYALGRTKLRFAVA